ncbi:hypothetical protein [Nonomuraea bangladeshensis]|uniref:hypothetical protein n=1 Tax=Nonomuraea bangladeshensis TaxID=404385 RepID=UPI0031E3E379
MTTAIVESGESLTLLFEGIAPPSICTAGCRAPDPAAPAISTTGQLAAPGG